MRRNVLKSDFLLALHQDGKRKSLGVLVYSVSRLYYFLQSPKILLSDDHCGPSTKRGHSRALKIEPQSGVRSQSDGREREGSLIAEIVNMKDLVFSNGTFHPSEIINDEVMALSV